MEDRLENVIKEGMKPYEEMTIFQTLGGNVLLINMRGGCEIVFSLIIILINGWMFEFLKFDGVLSLNLNSPLAYFK